MASIWMQAPGHAAEKLNGMLPGHAVVGLFKIRVAKIAKQNGAKVVYQDDMEAVLELPPKPQPGNAKVSDLAIAPAPAYAVLWVEPCSPPSAPEPGQPKVLPGQDKGILVTKKGAVELALPVKP